MLKTALYNAHEAAGAKIVEFAGYAMPVQYADGILKEHLSVRETGGLFDVSHMGQALLTGKGCSEFCNEITPTHFLNVPLSTAKYTLLINKNYGIVDDLIITKISEDKFFLVYNAGCKEKDEAWISSRLPATLKFEPLRDRSLLALQGARSEEVISKLFPEGNFSEQKYMTLQTVPSATYGEVFASRLGYTGEDGFEISVQNDKATQLWDAILAEGIKPIGLGARDSLRLEMGYPLYGHDINDETTPLEANLAWVVAKINREKFAVPKKMRVGFEVEDRSIVREGAKVFSVGGQEIGVVTSGGFSPSLQKPIAQGYIDIAYSTADTSICFELRGRKVPGKVAPLSFLRPKTKNAK